ERVSRERIYSVTGIQFIQINTLFQFYAACLFTPKVVDAAHALVTIPDLLNYWLSGRLCSEYTVATTTQFVDARSRTWAKRMISGSRAPAAVVDGAGARGRRGGKAAPRRLAGARRHAGRRPGMPRHRVGGRVGVRRRIDGVHQLGHVVAARHRDRRAGDQ